MTKLANTIGAVIGGTIVSGLAGGGVGAVIGRFAPSFVRWIYMPGDNAAPADFVPTEFGFGLGAVSGLFLGAGTSVLLAIAFIIRDMVVARREAVAGTAKAPGTVGHFE